MVEFGLLSMVASKHYDCLAASCLWTASFLCHFSSYCLGLTFYNHNWKRDKLIESEVLCRLGLALGEGVSSYCVNENELKSWTVV